ncbi:MAG: hypothetical protein ACI8O8_002995 [Oleiphilaceae bacterium]|jgi:hypothetical protein
MANDELETSKNNKPKYVVQTIIGGVVGAGLVAAWIIGYLNPILTAQGKVNEQQNKVTLLEIEEQRLYISRSQEMLKESEKKYRMELNMLRVENKTLEDELKQVQKTLIEASTKASNTESFETELKQIEIVSKSIENSQSRIEDQIKEANTSRSQVLPISWVKPSDWLGRHYHLKIDDNVYLWPVTINDDLNEAKVIINTSGSSRDDGKLIVDNKIMKVGDTIEFEYEKSIYELKLLSIRKAGKLPTAAGYFEAVKLN